MLTRREGWATVDKTRPEAREAHWGKPVALESASPPNRRRLIGVVLVAGVAALGLAGLTGQQRSQAITRIGSAAAPATSTSSTSAGAAALITTTTAKATSTTAAPTTTAGPTTTAAAVTTTAPPMAFCPLAVAYVQDLRRMSISLTDPSQLRRLTQHASPAIAQSAASAPPEVKADVALLVTTIADYAAALEKAGYELAKLPPDMVTKLQTPPVQNAINHVDSYVRKACAPA